MESRRRFAKLKLKITGVFGQPAGKSRSQIILGTIKMLKK